MMIIGDIATHDTWVVTENGLDQGYFREFQVGTNKDEILEWVEECREYRKLNYPWLFNSISKWGARKI